VKQEPLVKNERDVLRATSPV